jgi:hypothetical protein
MFEPSASSHSASAANNLLKMVTFFRSSDNCCGQAGNHPRGVALSVILCAALLAIALPAFADLQPGEISNVQVGNILPTEVTITWTTVHPGSSWVLFNFYNTGGMLPGRKVGREESVTSHSVTLNGLSPYNSCCNQDVGQYSYYVASQLTADGSWASFGGPQTNAYAGVISFSTTPLVTTDPLNVRMTPIGQKNIYAGHDLYMMPTFTLLSGGAGAQMGKIAVMTSNAVYDSGNNKVAWQVDILDTLSAYPLGFNPPPNWDGKIYTFGSGPQAGKEYVWGAGQANWATSTQMNGDQGAIRVRVPSNAIPGEYTLVAALQMFTDDGATDPIGPVFYVTWPFNVSAPAVFNATPPNTFPPIPNLALWQTTMVANGVAGADYWCSGTTAVVPVSSMENAAFLGPAYSLIGNFNAVGQPDAQKPYNYDGGRIYLQIADYDYNTPGMPGYHNPARRAYWEHCAYMILYPYDNFMTRSQGQFINEPNQHMLGTGMYYARTQDPTAASTLSNVTDADGPFAGIYGFLDTRNMRIVSYIWDTQTANEASGLHGPWTLSGPATDIALAVLDMFQQFASDQGQSFEPLWNYHNYTLGLLMESLIDQYELDAEKNRTPDPRIPLEIGKTLYALYDTFYFPDIGTTCYSFLEIPMSHVWNDSASIDVWANLSNLFDSAAAWYWSKTSDDTIRGYGDNMFKNVFNDTADLTWAPKPFNEAYKWSFDFVRYRSGPNPKPTFLQSQNPFEGTWPDTLPALIMNEYSCGKNGAFCENSNIPAPMVNGTTVTLSWDTIIPATTEVYYTTSSPAKCVYTPGAYLTSVSNCLAKYNLHYSADPGGVRHHVAVLSGLLSSTAYHYILYSTRTWGAMTPDATFTTGAPFSRPIASPPVTLNVSDVHSEGDNNNYCPLPCGGCLFQEDNPGCRRLLPSPDIIPEN